MDMLARICETLDCGIMDVIELDGDIGGKTIDKVKAEYMQAYQS